MIYVIMPVHNRVDITRRCLETLCRQSRNDYTVIVVDDGSTDGTEEIITSQYKDVILLKGDGNLWWTGATNLGIEHAISLASDMDYVMLLNDDLVVDDNFIDTAYTLIDEHPDTLIQAIEMNANSTNTILNGGWKINWYTAKYYQINSGKNINTFPDGYYENVTTQTGRGTLIPIRVIEDIGLYNSSHYPQCGDFEYPIRAYNNGYKLIMCYDWRIYSFAEETCAMNANKKYTITDLYSYFTDRRSYAYFPSRFWFAYDATTNPISGTFFLIFDLFRVSAHFVKNLHLFK